MLGMDTSNYTAAVGKKLQDMWEKGSEYIHVGVMVNDLIWQKHYA